MKYAVIVVALVWGASAWAVAPPIGDLDWECVRPVYVIAGDFDGDGWDDIALACHSCDTVLLGLNPNKKECPVPWVTQRSISSPTPPWPLIGDCLEKE